MGYLLSLSALCSLVALLSACSGHPSGPVYGEGCSDDQQDIVTLEGETRVSEVFVTREYVEVEIYGSEKVVERRYRTCQGYRCNVIRERPLDPMTETESVDALAACRAEADSAWRTEHGN